jgi:cell division septal protein FtsQ
MLEYNAREREKAFDNWLDKKKSATKGFLLKRKKRIAGILILLSLCFAAFFAIPNANLWRFIPFEKITAKNLDRLSEDAFRKIMGYDYGEKIYAKDTTEIRARLAVSDVILGDIRFSIKLFSRELEVMFSEARPLFVLMPQNSDLHSVIYSDKGKIYPYNINTADLPVVEAHEHSDISLAIAFLNEMKIHDASLYSRVSQIIPSEDKRQIIVFFNDVNFKTKFSTDNSYWQVAFRYYRQLTRNMRVSHLDSISILDLRFKQLAYTKNNGGSHGQ